MLKVENLTIRFEDREEKITYSRETERTADAGYHKAVGDQYFRRDRPFLCDRFCGFRFYHSRILL